MPKQHVPDIDEWAETCVLDVADRGGMILEAVGDVLGVTRERVRQLEVRARRMFHERSGRLLDGFIAAEQLPPPPPQEKARLAVGRPRSTRVADLLQAKGHWLSSEGVARALSVTPDYARQRLRALRDAGKTEVRRESFSGGRSHLLHRWAGGEA